MTYRGKKKGLGLENHPQGILILCLVANTRCIMQVTGGVCNLAVWLIPLRTHH